MTLDKDLIAACTIKVNAKPSDVWKVLTEPEYVKKFLFGTQVSTDWKVGSSIRFSGEYNGHRYEDKGNVLENKTDMLLRYNYWSGMSGLSDKEENYASVTYKIEPLSHTSCNFTWHQAGFSSEERKCHTEEGLKHMLDTIKNLAETLE